ncbi:hypothetical protein Agub_g14553, partial [Astrephomene gubernaculifera]
MATSLHIYANLVWRGGSDESRIKRLAASKLLTVPHYRLPLQELSTVLESSLASGVPGELVAAEHLVSILSADRCFSFSEITGNVLVDAAALLGAGKASLKELIERTWSCDSPSSWAKNMLASFIVSRHQIDTRAADLFLAPVQDAERALAAAWEAAAAAAPPSPLPYSSLDELLADEPCLELLQRQQGEQGQGFVRLVFSTLLQQQQQQPQQHQQQQQQEGRLEGEEARQQRGQQGETRVTPPRPRMQSAPDTVTAAEVKRGDGGGGGAAPSRDNDSPAGGVIGGGGDDLCFIEEREDDDGEEGLAGGAGGGGLYGTEYGEEEDQEEGAFDAMYGTVADPYGDDVTVDDVDYGGSGGLGDGGLGGLGLSAADALEEVGEADDDAAAAAEEEEEEQQQEEEEGVHGTAAATTRGTSRRYGAGSPMTARTTHRSSSASATSASATTTLTTTAAEHWPLRPDLLRHYVRLVFSGPGAAERLAAAAALTLAAAGLRTTVAAAAGATAVRAHGSYDARRFQMPLPELLRRLRKTVPQLLPPVPEAASAGRVGSAAADVLVVGSWLLKRLSGARG